MCMTGFGGAASKGVHASPEDHSKRWVGMGVDEWCYWVMRVQESCGHAARKPYRQKYSKLRNHIRTGITMSVST